MYSLRKLSKTVNLTSELITLQIKEKYKYLLITNTTAQDSIINTKSFVSADYDDGIVTLKLKIDLGKSDLFGCDSLREILKEIPIENLNKIDEPIFKLIFSPQIARTLLKAGYTIVDIKPRKDSPDEVVFIFEVEDGFYDVIEKWKNNNNNNNNNNNKSGPVIRKEWPGLAVEKKNVEEYDTRIISAEELLDKIKK